jgi:hypothetical protein
MNPPISSEDAADGLREQAASFRRLARRTRTGSGWTALTRFADQFDADASRIDPRSLRDDPFRPFEEDT